MRPNYLFFLLPFSAPLRHSLGDSLIFLNPFSTHLINSVFHLFVISTLPVIVPKNLIKKLNPLVVDQLRLFCNLCVQVFRIF